METTKKRQIEISVETHEIKIIRISGGGMNSAYCEQCGLETRFFTPAEIAGIFQIADEKFEQILKNGELHLIKPGENPPLVCGKFTETKNKFCEGFID